MHLRFNDLTSGLPPDAGTLVKMLAYYASMKRALQLSHNLIEMTLPPP
jgi:hypothetical protein